MFENLKQIGLLNYHIDKLHRAMILTTSINGNSHQLFLSQQNTQGTHSERAGRILYVHRCAKVTVLVVENQFCTEEVPIRVSSDNTSEIIRYMDPISRVFYRNFRLINCNPMYPNALELRNSSWITYGRRIQLIEKPNDMPNYRVNVNWSTSAPMEGFFNDKDLELELTQLQSPNIVDKAAIAVGELSEMQHRIEEQQKKIDNSEMLGTAGSRLEEELRQLKVESRRLGDQLLETKRQLEYAGNQRESCRRQVETLKKELKEVTNVAETKTRECIALVDERECLARELENAEIDKRKLRGRVKTEQTSKKVIQRRLQAINAQSPFNRPPNFYELLFLLQGATTSTTHKLFKTLAMLCHLDKGGRGDMFKIILQAKKIMEDQEAHNIYDKYGIEKAQEYKNSKMDI